MVGDAVVGTVFVDVVEVEAVVLGVEAVEEELVVLVLVDVVALLTRSTDPLSQRGPLGRAIPR